MPQELFGKERMHLFLHLSILLCLLIALYNRRSMSSNFLLLQCLSVILGEFPSRSLKCSVHLLSLSSWKAASRFAVEVPFFSHILLTLCHSYRDYLFPTEFLIYQFS